MFASETKEFCDTIKLRELPKDVTYQIGKNVRMMILKSEMDNPQESS